MRNAAICLALAFVAAPSLALAAPGRSSVSATLIGAPAALAVTRFDLAPGGDARPIVVNGRRITRFTPQSRQARESEGRRFGDDGEAHYIDGPAWDYHASQKGPMFEVAALGGGIENTPYLAHVAMNWQF